MKNNKTFGAWYTVSILEIIITMQFVELTTIDIVLRVTIILSGAVCIWFGWINVLKIISTGIFVLSCNGVVGMLNKIYSDETEIVRAQIIKSKEPIPVLNLAKCKNAESPYRCEQAEKQDIDKSRKLVYAENKLKDQSALTPQVEVPFRKTLPVLLYAILSGVFSVGAVVAASVKTSPSRHQENDVKKTETIFSKAKTMEIQKFRNQVKPVSWQKLAEANGYGQDHKKIKRHYDQAVQEFGLTDQKTSKTELKLLRGKSA